MPVRFRCARRLLCSIRNLNIVICSCLARRLIGSVEGLQPPVAHLIGIFDSFRAGFWLPDEWRWTGCWWSLDANNDTTRYHKKKKKKKKKDSEVTASTFVCVRV